MANILIVEDDVTLGGLLAERLRGQGHGANVAADGNAGLQTALRDRPDLIILDIMLPFLDGWELCRRFRRESRAPVLMLSARTDPQDVVRGLESGADDYVRKPFDLVELELRIEVLLRRACGEAPGAPCIYDDGNLHIDLERKIVLRKGEPVHLTRTEFALLVCLVADAGKLLPHAELLRQVWGDGYIDDASVLSVYIRYLREKLENDPTDPAYILTEWGRGYRFMPGGRQRM